MSLPKSPAWKTRNSTVEYENPFMRVVKHDVVRPNGFVGPYYVLERTPFSVVIPFESIEKIHLVGQYRYPIGVYSWEFPMGTIASTDPLKTAKQELSEETGLQAENWQQIGNYAIAPGHNNQIAALFLAQKLTQGKATPERGEILKTKTVGFDDLSNMIADGNIIDGITICAFHFLEVYLKNLKLET